MPVYNPATPTVGQKTMAGSEPVTIASDQIKFPIEIGDDTTANIVAVVSNGNTFADFKNGIMLFGKSGTTGAGATARPVLLENDGTVHSLENNSAAMLADLAILAGIVSSAKAAMKAGTGDIVDLATLLGLLLAQGSTTSGQSGPLMQGAVSTSSPSYTNGQTSPFSITPSGGLRVAESGTWTVQPGNTPNTTAWLMKLLGATTQFIAAGTSANTVVKNSAGTFYGVFASTIGAGGGLIYDNATTNTGTPVGVAPTAVGFDQGVPEVGVACTNGITVAGSATNPALTIFYI